MYTLNDKEIFTTENNNYSWHITNGKKLLDKLHNHTFYEFILILSGECQHKVNNNIYEMKKYSLICLFPGDTHLFLSQSEGTSAFSLSVKKAEAEKFISAYCDSLSFDLTNRLFELPADKVYVIEDICQKSFLSENNDMIISNKIILGEILHGIISTYISTYNEMPEALAKALKKISEDFKFLHEGVTSIEKLSGYSRVQITRLMKRYLKTTPQDYIKELRLRSAYSLIINSNLETSDISEKVGYSSCEHFQKIFKQHFNITPFKLRKRYEEIKSI